MFGFGNKRLEGQIFELREEVAELRSGIQTLGNMITDLKIETVRNRTAIVKDKNPTREVIKEITITRARKKPRERIRKTEGGSRITGKEKREFIALFDQGLSYTEISGRTGRSAAAISKHIYDIKKGLDESQIKTKK